MELNNSKIKIKTKNLNVYYGAKQALFDINLDINQKEVTALKQKVKSKEKKR